jgi:hypothetical protein
MRYNREEKESFKARGRDKNLLINFYWSFKVFFAKNQRRNYLQYMSYLLSKNLDNIFEDPKRIIAKTNLAFSHNTYCVKINL